MVKTDPNWRQWKQKAGLPPGRGLGGVTGGGDGWKDGTPTEDWETAIVDFEIR